MLEKIDGSVEMRSVPVTNTTTALLVNYNPNRVALRLQNDSGFAQVQVHSSPQGPGNVLAGGFFLELPTDVRSVAEFSDRAWRRMIQGPLYARALQGSTSQVLLVEVFEY